MSGVNITIFLISSTNGRSKVVILGFSLLNQRAASSMCFLENLSQGIDDKFMQAQVGRCLRVTSQTDNTPYRAIQLQVTTSITYTGGQTEGVKMQLSMTSTHTQEGKQRV